MQMSKTYPDSPMRFLPLGAFSRTLSRHGAAWFLQEKRWRRTRRLCDKVLASFTVHPAETDETYLQHLWFTTRMTSHFMLLALLLFTHGIFPFLFTRTVSTQIDGIYRIMRARVPKSLRPKAGEYII
jgi:hypothetical protein